MVTFGKWHLPPFFFVDIVKHSLEYGVQHYYYDIFLRCHYRKIKHILKDMKVTSAESTMGMTKNSVSHT